MVISLTLVGLPVAFRVRGLGLRALGFLFDVIAFFFGVCLCGSWFGSFSVPRGLRDLQGCFSSKHRYPSKRESGFRTRKTSPVVRA